MGDDGRYTHDRSDPLQALRNIRVGQTLFLTEDFNADEVRGEISGSEKREEVNGRKGREEIEGDIWEGGRWTGGMEGVDS